MNSGACVDGTVPTPLVYPSCIFYDKAESGDVPKDEVRRGVPDYHKWNITSDTFETANQYIYSNHDHVRVKPLKR